MANNEDAIDLMREHARLKERNAMAEERLTEYHRVLHQIQLRQPAGSPPGGGLEVFTVWVLQSMEADLSTARQSLYEVVEQRNQAIAYAKTLEAGRTLTCVYCGHAYPPGSPDHGANVLTEHIKVCKKHPMRSLEKENKRLKTILRDLCARHPDTCACRGCREAFAPKEGK